MSRRATCPDMIKRAGGCIAELPTGLCARIFIYTAVTFGQRQITYNAHRETGTILLKKELVKDGLADL